MKIYSFEQLVRYKNKLISLPIKELRRIDDQKYYKYFDKATSKKTVLKIVNKSFDGKKIVLVPNLFPYSALLNNLDGVVHYCLWSRTGYLPDNKISQIISKKFKNKKFIYFERSSKYKSVPEIVHYQVFIKIR